MAQRPPVEAAVPMMTEMPSGSLSGDLRFILRFSALDHLIHNAADGRKAEMCQPRKIVLAGRAVLHRLPEQSRVLPLEFACVCHGAPLFKILFNSMLIS